MTEHEILSLLISFVALFMSILGYRLAYRAQQKNEERFLLEQEDRKLRVSARRITGYSLSTFIPEILASISLTFINLANSEKRFENLKLTILFGNDYDSPFDKVKPHLIIEFKADGSNLVSRLHTPTNTYSPIQVQPRDLWMEIRDINTGESPNLAGVLIFPTGPHKYFWEIEIHASKSFKKYLSVAQLHPKELQMSVQFDDEDLARSYPIDYQSRRQFQILAFRLGLRQKYNKAGSDLGRAVGWVIGVVVFMPARLGEKIGYWLGYTLTDKIIRLFKVHK